jgi:hypothetical protein
VPLPKHDRRTEINALLEHAENDLKCTTSKIEVLASVAIELLTENEKLREENEALHAHVANLEKTEPLVDAVERHLTSCPDDECRACEEFCAAVDSIAGGVRPG